MNVLTPKLQQNAGPSKATAGPGKPISRGAITTSFRMRRDRDAKDVEKDEMWGGVSPNHPIRGSGRASQPGPGRIDFVHF